MTPQEKDYVELGRRWSAISQEQNPDKLGALLSDDFIMWYNFENLERNKEQFLVTLRNAHKVFRDQVHENERILPTPQGFVLQATMWGTVNGKRVAAPFCLVATVRNGKVVRGDEYFDTSSMSTHPAPGSTEMVLK